MAKDLIIGAFTNYDEFQVLRPWVQSINDSGFEGDKVLIAINTTQEMCQEIIDAGFKVIAVTDTEQKLRVHMLRFIHVYDYLNKHADDYRYVITTDVRDVIFQSNPSRFMEDYFKLRRHWLKLIVQSEAIKIKDEAWNRDNIIKNFGKFFYEDVKEKEVLNVGLIAGLTHSVKDLCFFLFQMSLNRPDWVADQAAYNMICNFSPFKDSIKVMRLEDAWALNAHVTNKPDQMEEFGPYLLEERPKMIDGVIYNSRGDPFVIVHQYDRVPEWMDYFSKKYDLNFNSKTNFGSAPKYFTYKTN
jgi:hypothetical protein